MQRFADISLFIVWSLKAMGFFRNSSRIFTNVKFLLFEIIKVVDYFEVVLVFKKQLPLRDSVKRKLPSAYSGSIDYPSVILLFLSFHLNQNSCV